MTNNLLIDLAPAGAILLSGSVALYGIWRNRVTVGRRCTVDMIQTSEMTPSFVEAATVFREYVRHDSLSKLHNPSTPDEERHRRQVIKFINHYEVVSIALLNRFLDERIYREWMQTNFLYDWNSSAPFIQRERWKYSDADRTWTYRTRMYENFQRLAMKWGRQTGYHVEPAHQSVSSPPPRPEGPVDQRKVIPIATARRVAREQRKLVRAALRQGRARANSGT